LLKRGRSEIKNQLDKYIEDKIFYVTLEKLIKDVDLEEDIILYTIYKSIKPKVLVNNYYITPYKNGIKLNKIDDTNYSSRIKIIINEDKIKKESIPTVIYIWATWCSICKANSYIIRFNYSIASVLNINFISLEEGENKESPRNYLSKESIPYPLGLLNENISYMYNISEFPTFIFVNKDNILKLKDSGMINPLSF
jgi:thiol-disulfide isomerase/thioredoxin